MPFWMLSGSIKSYDWIYIDLMIDGKTQSCLVQFWFLGFTLPNPKIWFYHKGKLMHMDAMMAIVNF